MTNFWLAANRPPLLNAAGGNQIAAKLYDTRLGLLHCCECQADTDHTTAWHQEQHLGSQPC